RRILDCGSNIRCGRQTSVRARRYFYLWATLSSSLQHLCAKLVYSRSPSRARHQGHLCRNSRNPQHAHVCGETVWVSDRRNPCCSCELPGDLFLYYHLPRDLPRTSVAIQSNFSFTIARIRRCCLAGYTHFSLGSRAGGCLRSFLRSAGG